MVKKPPASAGDAGLIPESGRCPGGGNGNSLQYSCLENPHGQRSLAGYSPWGRKESDTAKPQSMHEDIKCGPSLHILICHLYIFFGKVSVKVFYLTLFFRIVSALFDFLFFRMILESAWGQLLMKLH